jgi:shikimate dehydrogenase
LHWLVVGTGGSAQGVLVAAAAAGAAIAVQSRSGERAQAFSRLAAESGVALIDPAECDVVVNATPLGMHADDPSPISLATLPRAKAVLDLVYRRGETALVRAARALGLPAADGREVLLGQGAAAFRCWFPDREPPMDLMRAALRDHLG